MAHYKQGDSHSEKSVPSPFSQPSVFQSQVRPRHPVQTILVLLVAILFFHPVFALLLERKTNALLLLPTMIYAQHTLNLNAWRPGYV